MSRKTFTVVGATGNIGHVVAETLLAHGHAVRAIGRDRKKLDALVAKGAQAVDAPVDDAKKLEAALRGADAAFLMIPPDYAAPDLSVWQDRAGEATAAAVRASGLRRAVNLSSVGAQHPRGTGPIAFLHRQEQRLDWIPGLDVVHLRPGYFMQNFLWAIPTLKEGFHASAVRPDVAIEMVHTDDIGKKVAELLEEPRWSGKLVHDFSGPRAVSLREAVSTIGRELGKELKNVTPSYDEEEKAMVAHGMQAGTARLMVEMSRGMNDGLVVPTQLLGPDHRGSISFETWAAVLARAVRG